MSKSIAALHQEHFSSFSTLVASACMLLALLLSIGCGQGNFNNAKQSSNPPASTSDTLTVSVDASQLITGSTTHFHVLSNQGGTAPSGGTWSLVGTGQIGSIDQDGTFHAPTVVPSPNTVAASYTLGSVSASASTAVMNPAPQISSASPATIGLQTSSVTLTGAGFLASSTFTVNGKAVTAIILDAQHVTVPVSPETDPSLKQTVVATNPTPIDPAPASIILAGAPLNFTVAPAILPVSSSTISITGNNFIAEDVIAIDGTPVPTTFVSSTVLSATIYIKPWRTGSASVQVMDTKTSTFLLTLTVPIITTPVTYDAAARFTTQAAFGPRPDLVLHVQALGLNSFLDEQMTQPTITFPGNVPSRTFWLQSAMTGNSLLRQRVSLALQSFIVTEGFYIHQPYEFWEMKMENNAFGNVRQLLSAITSDASMGEFLNITGNASPADPSLHPNQNFARELLQLFTLGPVSLHDDGSLVMDVNGQPVPTYGQDTILDLSRALTGWNEAPIKNPYYAFNGVDWSQPLVATESQHDHNSKLLFGSSTLPSGQTAASDRDAALDVIFAHSNLPPFFSKILIQRLVTSNPSPAYVARISAVFKDDGTHVRGNLAAVIKAILLDDEARAGDSGRGSSLDGFLQQPALFEAFAGSVMENPGSDGQIESLPGLLGDELWAPPNVFGAFSPSNLIPGTNILSPEFQIFDNLSILHRSEALWGMTTGTTGGWSVNWNSWLMSGFAHYEDEIEALNHLVYHGQMPQQEQTAILNYCNSLGSDNWRNARMAAIFLALNSDSFTVAH